MEFFDWSILATFAGATFAVGILTEITKSIPGIDHIPTQLWSFVLAAIVLVCARAFTSGLDVASVVLSVINAAMVALAANGGYEALQRLLKNANNNKEE